MRAALAAQCPLVINTLLAGRKLAWILSAYKSSWSSTCNVPCLAKHILAVPSMAIKQQTCMLTLHTNSLLLTALAKCSCVDLLTFLPLNSSPPHPPPISRCLFHFQTSDINSFGKENTFRFPKTQQYIMSLYDCKGIKGTYYNQGVQSICSSFIQNVCFNEVIAPSTTYSTY